MNDQPEERTEDVPDRREGLTEEQQATIDAGRRALEAMSDIKLSGPVKWRPAPMLNIHQRIAAVRAGMEGGGYMQKNAKISGFGGGYTALTYDKLIHAVRPLLVKHGVLVVPHHVESSRVEGVTKNGGRVLRYSATFDVEFINVDNPADKLHMLTEVDADDAGDKAPPKAQTIAKRIALRSILDIETGEDEEQRGEELVPTAPDGTPIPDISTMTATCEYIEKHVLAKDYGLAYEALAELTQGERTAIWKSPSKGGLWCQEAWNDISRGEFRAYCNKQRAST